MKRFRNIDILPLTYQVLRSNYSIYRTIDQEGKLKLSLNILYRYIVSCLYDIKEWFSDFGKERDLCFMIANCMPVNGQVQLVLNNIFGSFGQITVGITTFQSSYLFDKDSATALTMVYFYTDDQGNPVYYGEIGASENVTIITAPSALYENTEQYSEFVAILRSLVPYGIKYIIQIS